MTTERVLELLASAISSEEGFTEEFLRRREFCRAAEANARLQALTAFRDVLLEQLGREERGGW